MNVCIAQLMIMQEDRDKLKYFSKLFKDSFTSVSNDHLITIELLQSRVSYTGIVNAKSAKS